MVKLVNMVGLTFRIIFFCQTILGSVGVAGHLVKIATS